MLRNMTYINCEKCPNELVFRTNKSNGSNTSISRYNSTTKSITKTTIPNFSLVNFVL